MLKLRRVVLIALVVALGGATSAGAGDGPTGNSWQKLPESWASQLRAGGGRGLSPPDVEDSLGGIGGSGGSPF